MNRVLFFFAFFSLFVACTEKSRPLADHDTAAVNDHDTAVTDETADDQSDPTDQSDQSDDLIADDIITDETGDDLLSDSDTPVICADVALNDCSDTPGCVLSELPIISNYGSCYTEVVPVACMATADKVCPPEQWADPEYVYDPATGRCFLFYTGCFPASWEYQVGTYPEQCAGGVAPITLPPCGTACHGLASAECSQTPDCVSLNSQRLRWDENGQPDCIEDDSWVGCFANSELACRDSAYYPVVDLNGDCWISNGCEPLWWTYPSEGDHCWIDGSGGSQISPCSARR